MATYVKLLRSIWRDREFVGLDGMTQRLYLLLISQPDISAVGVLTTAAGRWSTLAPDTTPMDIREALDELEAARFVVVNPVTEELWVRTYITHDEAWRSPNGMKALVKARDQVISEGLRTLIARAIEGATQGASEGATKEAPVGDASPHEPSTMNHEPPAATAPESVDNTRPIHRTAAAAAIDILIENDVETGKARNADAWRKSMPSKYREEFRDSLAAYLERRPDATAEELACHVLGVPGFVPQSEAKRDWYADPGCETCSGDGLASEEDERGRCYFVPCPCRRAEPYPEHIADVVPITRKDEPA